MLISVIPFHIAIHLLAADTNLSVLWSMPSIPSKPDRRISVSCPFPEALIVINFACMIPLDIVIHLLPIDTALSDRNFVLSIPSKHNFQISLFCQSISVPPILVNVVFALVCPEFSEPHYLKQFSCNTNFLVLFVFSGLISFFVSENQCTHEMCLTPIDAACSTEHQPTRR